MQPARDLLRAVDELLPGGEVALINHLVYANAGALGDAAYRRFLFWINTARDVPQPPVRLGRYPPGACIDGNGPFHVLTEGVFVAESVFSGAQGLAANRQHMLRRRAEALEIGEPCLFAIHAGSRIWSHWLIDTMPKILLPEQACPGRFRFVVPASSTDPAAPDIFPRSVLESLAAYGIPQHRLLRLQPGLFYRFAALYDVVDLNGDGMHPGVLRALRTLATPPPFRGRYGVTACMRAAGEVRPVTNLPTLAPVLRAHRAAMLDPAATSFIDKVRAFRDSDVIVGDLGSNLATCLYASPGAAIVTIAPGGWRDSYFAQIFQRLHIHHADVRGTPLRTPGDAPGHSAQFVAPAHLNDGIEAAKGALARPPGPGPILVDGRRLARAPGPIVLRIDFGQCGNGAAFQRSPFAPPEPRHSWSLGPACRLSVPAGLLPAADLWVEIKGIGFTAPPHLVSRPFGIAANGHLLATFDIDLLTHLHVFLPGALHAAAELQLDIRHPVCPSPLIMGVSDDARPLGFMFEFIAFRHLAPTGGKASV